MRVLLYMAILTMSLIVFQCTASAPSEPGESGKPSVTGLPGAGSEVSSPPGGGGQSSGSPPATGQPEGPPGDLTGVNSGGASRTGVSSTGVDDQNLLGSDPAAHPVTTTTKVGTPPEDIGTLPDHTDHSPQRKQDRAPLQPPTTTTPRGAPAQQNPTPSKDADAGGQTDKGKQQEKTSTPVADDVATQTVPTNSDKEINVAQTSVTSTSVPTRRESTSPTTILPNLSNAMQHADKKDNTIGSSSLFALAALVTFVMITVAPAY